MTTMLSESFPWLRNDVAAAAKETWKEAKERIPTRCANLVSDNTVLFTSLFEDASVSLNLDTPSQTEIWTRGLLVGFT